MLATRQQAKQGSEAAERQGQARSKAGASQKQGRSMLGNMLRKDEPNLVLETETRPKRGSNEVQKQPKAPVAQPTGP